MNVGLGVDVQGLWLPAWAMALAGDLFATGFSRDLLGPLAELRPPLPLGISDPLAGGGAQPAALAAGRFLGCGCGLGCGFVADLSERAVQWANELFLRGGAVKNPKILILDDDPEFVGESAALFESAGFEVMTALDVKSAEPILTRLDPGIDLLIVDIVLPGSISGLDVISFVTKVRPFYKILVVSSAFRGDVLKYTSERMGADGFLEKPSNAEPLDAALWVGTVHRLLGREAMPAQPE